MKTTVETVAATTTTVKTATATATPPRVAVRYDAQCEKWSIADPATGEVKTPFERGILTDVEFTTIRTTKRVMRGCVSETVHGTIGLASGHLYLGATGAGDLAGWHNLAFDGERGFVNEDGSPMTRASRVRLMPGRRALYK